LTDELAAYDYSLPDELIARWPAARRDDARLIIVDRAAETVRHGLIRDLPDLLCAGDCLVMNDTRVVRARLLGYRPKTGGRWEGLFLDLASSGEWRLLSQCRGKLEAGEQIAIHPAHAPDSPERLVIELASREEGGIWRARPADEIDHWVALERFGTVPLPPYMHRERADAGDFDRYQTVYAKHRGSVAAPTAGLHFTPELLALCRERSVAQAFVTLHVGIGTFRPISVERLAEHRMHSEWCDVSEETVRRLEQTFARGGRRIAVGTTTARALESALRSGTLEAWRGATDLFIRPPYQFRSIDALLTNFHLPRSTLLVLVSTFAGRELILHAYREAIHARYRFYSYGDAMLII
jgi:S-adenosylmethionine:tRNA ribosyltransferase-isomerase